LTHQTLNIILLILSLNYFAAIGIAVILFARHFMGWLNNSIPSSESRGNVSEIFSLFINRNLTKAVIDHKNKTIR